MTTHETLLEENVTLRDYFAARAMQGRLSFGVNDDGDQSAFEAVIAYQIADAMLAARATHPAPIVEQQAFDKVRIAFNEALYPIPEPPSSPVVEQVEGEKVQNESLGLGWLRVELMVSPNGLDSYAIGGDHIADDGDSLYLGYETVKRWMKSHAQIEQLRTDLAAAREKAGLLP